MAFDIISDLNLTRGANQTIDSATPDNSAAIDMKGFEALTVYLRTGVVTAAGTGGIAIKIQHSDTLTGASFEDVPAAQFKLGGAAVIESNDDDNKVIGALGYFGGKRYVRAVLTGAANSDAVVFVDFLRGRSSSISRPVPTIGTTTATT